MISPDQGGTYLPVVLSLLLLTCVAALGYWLYLLRKSLRQAREALSTMEAVYANAPMGLAMLDTELRYIRINRLLAELNGVSVQDHIGKTVRDILPEMASQIEGPFLNAIHTGKPLIGIVFEGVTVAQPGVFRTWRENVYPIFGHDGKVTGLNVAVEEITEEKRLNDALQASELRERQRASELEVIMNATPAAILLARDAACDHITGNLESHRMLRLGPDGNASANHAGGSARPFMEYADGVPLRADQLPMQVAARTGKEVRGAEISFHFRNGDVIHTLVNAAPLFNEEGEVIGAVGAFVDVTARKLAEQALRHESRRKDEFLATLAHELRNPLASIQTGMELITLTSTASGSTARTLDIMDRQLSHLVRLIDDLLDVSRITSGKLELKKKNVAVKTIVDRAIEVSDLDVGMSGHMLDVDLPAAPLHVEADTVRMAQVLSNLLNNAAKYTPRGGTIRISVGQENGYALISVIDNGIGIEKEMLPRIFNMFSQLERGQDHRQGGIGIGLSLARQFTEMHGGMLTAESAGAGSGSTFTVHLPLLSASGEAGSGTSSSSKKTTAARHARILILDDNTDAAQMLGTLLEMAGHTVALAYTGKDAIMTAKEFRPDIAFLDIGLPDMSGHDVARALRREEDRLNELTLVALTGWGAQKDRAESSEAGFNFHLTKPVAVSAIQDILPHLAIPM